MGLLLFNSVCAFYFGAGVVCALRCGCGRMLDVFLSHSVLLPRDRVSTELEASRWAKLAGHVLSESTWLYSPTLELQHMQLCPAACVNAQYWNQILMLVQYALLSTESFPQLPPLPSINCSKVSTTWNSPFCPFWKCPVQWHWKCWPFLCGQHPFLSCKMETPYYWTIAL